MSEAEFRKREPRMDQRYFDEKVEYDHKTLLSFEEKVNDPLTNPTHRKRLRYTIFNRRRELLITRYSQGEGFAALKASFPAVVNALQAYQDEEGYENIDFNNLDDYVVALSLVSLALLFRVEGDTFDRLVSLLGNEGQDLLYEQLVQCRSRERPRAEKLLYPKPYKHLLEALNSSGEQRSRLLRRFIDGWYGGMKKTYWYEQHLNRDSGFFGYWCFELAALVECLDMDDASFRDMPYYPKDIVHTDI